MNKKVLICLIAIVIILIIGISFFFMKEIKKKEETKSTSNSSTTTSSKEAESTKPSSNGKTLVVYYSATGSTKHVALDIAEYLNADLFEIVPENIYTSADLDYTNDNSRVSKEHADESLRDVKLKTTQVERWENYDTVYIGYPIWWGVAAWPINTFVKENNFEGKTVIPFCTSASSDLGRSGENLKDIANTGNWKTGHRFNSSAGNEEVKNWLDSLK